MLLLHLYGLSWWDCRHAEFVLQATNAQGLGTRLGYATARMLSAWQGEKLEECSFGQILAWTRLLQRSFRSHANPVGSGTRLNVSLAHQKILAGHTKKNWLIHRYNTSWIHLCRIFKNCNSEQFLAKEFYCVTILAGVCWLKREYNVKLWRSYIQLSWLCHLFFSLSLFFFFLSLFFGDKLTNECIHKRETANMHTRIKRRREMVEEEEKEEEKTNNS